MVLSTEGIPRWCSGENVHAMQQTQEKHVRTLDLPQSGRCPGVGNCTLLQYSCLENSMSCGPRWGHKERDTEHTHTRQQQLRYRMLQPRTGNPETQNITDVTGGGTLVQAFGGFKVSPNHALLVNASKTGRALIPWE